MPAAPWESLALAVLLAVGEAAPTRQVHKHQHWDYLVEKLEQIRSNVSVASEVETPKLPAPRLVPASLSSERSFSKLKDNWEQYQLQCLKYFHETPPLLSEGKFCNRTFDDYICWPDGLPGTYVNMSCPWYLPTVKTGQVYRFCTLEGTWLLEENSTRPWRNTSECVLAGKDPSKERLLFLSVVYTTGYALSFSALVIATGILLGFSCWSKNHNMNYWLIIRLPILFAIGVNFLIFIRIICIIISKLQANLMCKTDIKCRLAKSTLTLIPLLGTHEIIFAFVTDEHAKGMLRFMKLFFELSSSSFQGLLVAVLYCFVNNEVQTEFQKSWERWRLEHFYVQRDSSMKPLKCPANSISSGGTLGSTVYAATCQATCS
ncbi:glucagon-like peptide 1 receptor isoform X2 [Paroedura picta]|uniref:glucagon-like peptide 1 receptor isoform X2 n=1 Tax=Paroedura picta TaxID=143630 RepID=UPI004055AD40